jgi:hypothetical protein
MIMESCDVTRKLGQGKGANPLTKLKEEFRKMLSPGQDGIPCELAGKKLK